MQHMFLSSTPRMAFLLSGTVYVGIRYSPHEATLSLKGYVRGPGFRPNECCQTQLYNIQSFFMLVTRRY